MSFDFSRSTALFGGSFNPPHLGHQVAVQGLFKNPQVQKVVLLPSFGTPLKKVAVNFEQRMEMTRLAFAQELSSLPIEVSRFEEEHKTEFTWQVLEKLGPQIRDLAFVIGADQFESLDQWAKFPDLMGMCDWIVLLRQPYTLAKLKPAIHRYVQAGALVATSNDHEFFTFKKRLKFVPTEAKEVSSTFLREKMATGHWESVKDLVAEPVRDYIRKYNVYGK